MSLIIELTILTLSFISLIKFSELTIDNAAKLSKITRIGELVMGFILISFITTFPELSVSVIATLNKQTDISISNILGSNITNMGLILGLAAILAPRTIKINRVELKTLSSMLFISSLIMLLLISFKASGIFTGLELLAIFIYFVYYSARKELEITSKKLKKDGSIKGGLRKTLVFLLLSIFGVIISSKFLVSSAAETARLIGISQSFIGATIIAFGTSVPELSVGIAGVRKGHTSISLGNLIGASLTNITLLLSVVIFLSYPANIDFASFSAMVIFVAFLSILVWYFLIKGKLTLRDGLTLFILYFVFLVVIIGIETVV